MKKIVMAVVAFFCLLIIGIGVLLGFANPSVDVPLEIAKGLISLTIAVVITGVLSYFLSERTRKQTERERQLLSALEVLKAAHLKMEAVRARLDTELSPMQLGEQFDALIDIKATLQHLRHERLIRDDWVPISGIKEMVNYVRVLRKEYASIRYAVIRDSITFERDRQRYLVGNVADPPDVATLDIHRLPFLMQFLDDEKFARSRFNEGYFETRSWIEDKLSERRVG